MLYRLPFFALFFSICFVNNAQVGIGTTSPDASSALDVFATDKGVLIPRLTAAQRNAIPNPANGLIVYNTDSDELQINTNTLIAPVWEALSATPSVSVTPGSSMKYSYVDTTTDVNDAMGIATPLFGLQEWNDDSSLYVVSGNQVTITSAGRYEIIANVSLVNATADDRNAPEIRLAIGGTEVASYGSTGYIRSNNGHEESSLHIREVIELPANSILTVVIKQSAQTSEVNLRSMGSSNIYIEKIL